MAKSSKPKRVRTRDRKKQKVDQMFRDMRDTINRSEKQIKDLQERLSAESKLGYERSKAAHEQDETIKRLKRDLGFARLRIHAQEVTIKTLTRLNVDGQDQLIEATDWTKAGAELATGLNDRDIASQERHPDVSWRDPRGYSARHHDDEVMTSALRAPMFAPKWFEQAARRAERYGASPRKVAETLGAEWVEEDEPIFPGETPSSPTISGKRVVTQLLKSALDHMKRGIDPRNHVCDTSCVARTCAQD